MASESFQKKQHYKKLKAVCDKRKNIGKTEVERAILVFIRRVCAS